MRNTIITVLAALALTATSASAAYNESRIRQSDQELKINGQAGAAVFFSVTGFAGDVINAPFGNGTVAQFKASGLVYDVVYHADGLITLRFCVIAKAGWNGQEVKLSHNGDWVDRDPIVIK